jgi:hypothetical protein
VVAVSLVVVLGQPYGLTPPPELPVGG